MKKILEKLFINPISILYNYLKFDAGNFPKKVQIETTNACNARCLMCPLKIMQRSVGYMEMGLFKKIIDEISHQKLRRLILHIMGEPLLHPQIFEMVKYIKQKNPKQEVEFSTNASLLDTKMSEKVIESGLDIINLSVDASTKEVYEKVRINLDYDTTMINIRRFLELLEKSEGKKPLAKIQLIKLPENQNEWENFRKEWEEFAKNRSYINLYIKEMGDWAGYLKKERSRGKNFYIKACCDAPFDSLDIFWNGDCSFCCLDYDGKLLVGNVKNKSIKEIWKGNKINAYRDKFIKNKYSNIPLCSMCENAPRTWNVSFNLKKIIKKIIKKAIIRK